MSTAVEGSQLTNIGQETGLQRMIKSDEEIAVTKISAAAADIGGEACKAAIREGVEEWQVGQEVVNAMTEYMAKHIDDRAEIMDAWAWIQSGIEHCYNHTIVSN